MKSLRYFLAVSALGLASAVAQISISSLNQTYTQDFNSMGNTTATYPAGWAGWKASGSCATMSNGTIVTDATTPKFTVNNGTGNTGTIYNYGSTGSDDRALGSVASSTFIGAFGASFINETGQMLTSNHVSMGFIAEQWRTGSSATDNETWVFSYKIGGNLTDLTGWTALSTFDLKEILTGSASAGAVDGNDPANRLALIPTAFSGLNWADNSTLHIRWADADSTSNDAGMAIDDFQFKVIPEPGTWIMIGLGTAFLLWRRKRLFS